MNLELDIYYMKRALLLAQQAAQAGEIPVGAIVVHHPQGAQAKDIGEGFNQRERDHDPTSHAEIVAMRRAGQALGHWRLLNCTLYVTLEPCPMCAGAMVNARLPRLVYGASDPKAGAVETLYKICTDARLNHRLEVVGGILADESGGVLKTFLHRGVLVNHCDFEYSANMTTEDMKQELERDPFVPLRLHLSSGQTLDITIPHTAWLRQNTLLIVHPLSRNTHVIGNYDVIALRLIERIETLGEAVPAA